MLQAVECAYSSCTIVFTQKYSGQRFCSHACYGKHKGEQAALQLWTRDREQGVPDNSRKCTKCTLVKELTEFHKDSRDYKGTGRVCKNCVSTRYADYYADNRDKLVKRSRVYYYNNTEKMKITAQKRVISKRLVEAKHNMPKGGWWILFSSQNERCANKNCDTPSGDRVNFWQVDHDHLCCPGERSCGKCIRGIICPNCNRAIGLLKNDGWRAQGLGDYLLTYKNSFIVVTCLLDENDEEYDDTVLYITSKTVLP